MMVIRVLLFFLVAAVTLLASLRVAADPTGLREVAWAIDWWFPILASVGLTLAIIAIDILTPRKKLSTISGVFLGLLGGLVAAVAVSFLVDLVVETYRIEGLRAQQIVSAVKILFGVAACYLGVSIVLQTQDDFRPVIPYVEFAKQIRGAKPLVQDSSALIDGRILDLAVAAENANFFYPESQLGFCGGLIAGCAARLPHKIAMEFMLTGKRFDAQRAYEVGMVNKVVPVGQQIEGAMEYARILADSAPLVMGMLKRFVRDEVVARGPSERQALARRQLLSLARSDDQKEGGAAFREKRKPVFTGR